MKLILLTCLFALALAVDPKPPLTLSGRARDFNEAAPDFEYFVCGLQTGLVAPVLVDGKPVLAEEKLFSGRPCIVSNATFATWYRDVEGVNFPLDITLTLVNTPGTDIYTFGSSSFFVFDDAAVPNWGKENQAHNYWFTVEFRWSFVYKPGVTFEFLGDDDVWVFVNGQLAIDLGGVHGAARASVNFDNLGLVEGQTYPLDIFYAERHTSESNFFATTTILFQDNTTPTDPPAPPKACPAFETCAGALSFPGQTDTYSAADFNAIFSEGFSVQTGDTQGRLLVGGSFSAGFGYSVGDQLTDGKNFSLIVNGSATYGSGAVYPNPAGYIYAESLEAPDYLVNDWLNDTAAGNFEFIDSAVACYESTAAGYAELEANVDWFYKYTGLFINITNELADRYVLSIPVDVFNAINWYCIDGAFSPDTEWIIRIVLESGKTEVVFSGDYIPVPNGKATYVIPAGGLVKVRTDVNGNILSGSPINQLGGVIRGKVVAPSYVSTGASQINFPCDDSLTAKLKAVVTEAGTTILNLESTCGLKKGDTLVGSKRGQATVLGVAGNTVWLSSPVSAAAGSTLSFVSSSYGSDSIVLPLGTEPFPIIATPAADDSSAIELAFSLALFFLCFLML